MPAACPGFAQRREVVAVVALGKRRLLARTLQGTETYKVGETGFLGRSVEEWLKASY
jgi:hypothetical protein